ncbi:MAG TPA: tetratricopeptide repeat protein [Gemmataceae bacterium]|nr:tetratricopeptide repeat protein [Gemmataceae bacterium]
MSSQELDAVNLVGAAQVLLRRREFAAAERLLHRALLLFHQTVGEDDLNCTVCLNNLGMLYHIVGDAARAEPLLREVVEIRRRLVGEAHPAYRNAVRELADFYRSRDDEAQAAFWQRHADGAEERLRKSSP